MKPFYQTAFLVTIFLFSILLNAQTNSPYEDALKLSDTSLFRSGKLSKSDAVNPILAKYVKTESTGIKPEEIRFAFNRNPQTGADQNPFIEISAGELSSLSDVNNGSTTVSSFNMTGISSFDVTTITQGVSQFLIQRAKEELTATFFNRLQKQFEKSPEIKTLFPKTSTVLENMITYHYAEILPTLQNYFQDDIENLPMNMGGLTELDRYKVFFEQNPELVVALKTVKLIDEMGKSSTHPIDIITKLADFTQWRDTLGSISFRNFGNTLKMGAILSNSLTITDYGVTKWINFKQWEKLLEKPGAFEIYMGLIYQQMKNEGIHFVEGSKKVLNVSDLIKNNRSTIIMYQEYLSSFLSIANQVKAEAATINFKKGRSEKPSNEELYQYIEASINIIDFTAEAANLIDQEVSTKVEVYSSILRNGNELFKSVFEKNYNTAVFNATLIYNQIAELIQKAPQDSVKAKVEGNIKETLNDISASKGKSRGLKSLKKELSKEKLDVEDLQKKVKRELNEIAENGSSLNSKLKKDLEELSVNLDQLQNKKSIAESADLLKKYGAFFANVAKAKTPDEVQSAIEAAVLPVGSSSIKKKSEYNISLQAYVGASYNTSFNAKPENAWENPFGVTAPIGVSFNRGMGKYGSVGIFVSLVDLGAIVDYDLSQDSTFNFPSGSGSSDTMTTVIVESNSDYKVELGQIFSPGIYFTYGFFNDIPLSLTAGAQYGPGLLSINQGNTEITSPNWRFVVSLTVDIPLFTLYNKERNHF